MSLLRVESEEKRLEKRVSGGEHGWPKHSMISVLKIQPSFPRGESVGKVYLKELAKSFFFIGVEVGGDFPNQISSFAQVFDRRLLLERPTLLSSTSCSPS